MRNAGVSARKIQAAVDEALAAVRAERLVPAVDYLVTGDRSGLLMLKRHGKTRIVTARQFSTAVTPKPRPRTRSR